MEKMIQALFDTELDAFKGLQAIQQLDSTEDIKVGETYVLVKDLDGKTSIRSAKDESEGDAALGGGLLGGLIGLLAGPLGFVVGVAGGMIAGSAGETLRAESVSEYLDAVSAEIPDGKSVLVAHVWENWETPLDAVLLPLTKDIRRFSVQEEIYVPVKSELEKLTEDISVAETRFLEAEGSQKLEWNATLTALREKRDRLQHRLSAQQDGIEQWRG
ncbi:DUF1269 domain-containing protein [Pedobacter sp. MC2016-14]|uniref:DUF1269 domain-containing protein n=1 Tax=Pedobacter sp. MC2016-14 TaxID=2897327 RepID=UPI001E50BA16|nr:DUF1269 domain-containing protein [Pedobacter sp. MC2016-14]MCD0488478.1 DUF1269 domain-containing protein [Pedobacter sp. MC2016-14]